MTFSEKRFDGDRDTGCRGTPTGNHNTKVNEAQSGEIVSLKSDLPVVHELSKMTLSYNHASKCAAPIESGLAADPR